MENLVLSHTWKMNPTQIRAYVLLLAGAILRLLLLWHLQPGSLLLRKELPGILICCAVHALGTSVLRQERVVRSVADSNRFTELAYLHGPSFDESPNLSTDHITIVHCHAAWKLIVVKIDDARLVQLRILALAACCRLGQG